MAAHHGLRYHPLYGRWNGMVQRCHDKNHVRYAKYGGKGITVCERWLSFPNFLADMGEPPAGASIERIDNSKGYSPENCIWADSSTQMRNTSRTRLIEFNGKTQCVTDWAKEIGIHESSLRERLTKWPVEKALTKSKSMNKGIKNGRL